MVRAALTSTRRIGAGPRWFAAYVPGATVLMGSLLTALPIIAMRGWYPDFGFVALIGWRLLRSDPWPSWWAAPLGLVNDLFTGAPIGLSVAFWSATMLALDLIDRRTMWRDYWTEWLLAAVLLLLNAAVERLGARLGGAAVPFSAMLPQLLISILAFPVIAWLISRLDRWRLAR